MNAKTICSVPTANGHTLYQTPWCSMLGCCGRDVDILHLYYPLADLQREVDMLTATLGGKRKTEDKEHLLDEINMTKDESPQFVSFVKTAMSKVFQVIGKYTKAVEKAYIFDEGHHTVIASSTGVSMTFKEGDWVELDGVLYKAEEDGETAKLEANKYPLVEQPIDFRHSVHYVIQWPKNLNPNFIEPLDQSIFDALKYYVMVEWLYISSPDDVEWYEKRYDDAIQEVRKCSTRLINVVVNRIPRAF